MWIDAHAHLSGLSDHECTAAVAAAREACVDAIVDTGTDLASSASAARRAQEHAPLVWACAGISPFDASAPPGLWLDELRSLARAPRVIGLGETGLDASNPRYPPTDVQQPVFEAHLALAAETRLPVILHSRGAERRVLHACREQGVDKALFHCFTGALDDLRGILDAGYFVSFSGIVTFRGSGLEPLVRHAPADRIFIETDAPYLAPHPHRGARNRPAWVVEAGRKVAEIKGMAEDVLAAGIRANFEALFGVVPALPGNP